MASRSFLFELYTEEIPAFYQIGALNDWRNTIDGILKENLIQYDNAQTGASARRIYVIINGIESLQSKVKKKLKGPPKNICFKDEKATPALTGFAQKANIPENKIAFETIDGKEYATAEIDEGGAPVAEILPQIFEKLITGQKFPKTMRWGNLDLQYARPIISYFAMLDDKRLAFSGGIWNIIEAAKSPAGLFYKNETVSLDNAANYVDAMKKAGVWVEPEKRQEEIIRLLKEAAGKHSPVIEERLLQEVNFLVEEPAVIQCSFEDKFLELPDILILSEMQEHQRYFALETDTPNGSGNAGRKKLSNKFLVIANGERGGSFKRIGQGNERVLRARLSDGAYFFHEDRKKKLIERSSSLETIVFQDGMGSMADKKERLKKIAASFIKKSGLGKNISTGDLDRAGDLLKADLTTLLVYEFDHLQGEIGSIYAEMDGEKPEICGAIREHYMPKNQGDDYPAEEMGIVYSVCEKIDNILSGFILGKTPKATQDPLGLRRQTLYLIEIFIQNRIHLNFHEWLQELLNIYPNAGDKAKLADDVWDFVRVRMETIFEKEGFDKKLIQAGIRTGSDDLYDIYLKMDALRELKSDENFALLMGAFKRMNNIVTDYFSKNKTELGAVDTGLFEHDEEQKIYSHSVELKNLYDGQSKTKEGYEKIFQFLASMKKDTDSFFDSVMVMAENESVRKNRVSLLSDTVGTVKKLMDVSYLQ